MGTKYNKKYFDISKENLEIMEDFKDYRLALGRGSGTIRSNITLLRRLGNWLGDKSFKDATETDMIDFFKQPDIQRKWRTKDNYGTILIMFYRWLFKLKRKERPQILDWFEYTPKPTRRKSKDPKAKEKYFITRDEYDAIINHCNTYMERALFEVMYNSGARPDEVAHMRIQDVEILDDGKVFFTFFKSKTDPRKIPIGEPIDNLLRWLDFHPAKDNPKAPLWLSFFRSKLKLPIEERSMDTYTIGHKFSEIKKRAGLKSTLTPKSFRKTRASIMFPNTKDKDMGYFFGWTEETVPLRRFEYDLTGNEDFIKKVFAKSKQPVLRDELERRNETIEKKQASEIQNLQRQYAQLQQDHKQLQQEFLDVLKKVDAKFGT
jgi:integrase